MCATTETKFTAADNSAIRQWTNRPCGALDDLDELSLAYFEAVERDRYENYAPWMREFVSFGSYVGKRVLEVGVGQGTDLVQFAKGGAQVFGIDITQRHLEIAAQNFRCAGMRAKLAVRHRRRHSI